MKIRQKYDELVIEGIDTISELNTFYIQNEHKFESGMKVTPKAYSNWCHLIWLDERMNAIMGLPFKEHPVNVECHIDHPGFTFRGIELEVI